MLAVCCAWVSAAVKAHESNMIEMIVREARAQDYSDLCALIDQVDELHRDRFPHIFQKPDGPARGRDYILGLMMDENVGLFVAKVEGKLVGFVHVIIRDSPAIPICVPRRDAIVDSIAVDTGFQQRGIGRALMGQAHYWAKEQGATAIELNVYEFNQGAIAFYQTFGYTATSRKMTKSLR
jgi:ribosomal protein S18 acetylase RimI-like enzyme